MPEGAPMSRAFLTAMLAVATAGCDGDRSGTGGELGARSHHVGEGGGQRDGR